MRCVHFNIRGKVQGVWFRQSTKNTAQSLSLTGWVCNKSDGSVELVACGEDKNLMLLEEWLQQGPPAATVDSVISESCLIKSFDDFQVK